MEIINSYSTNYMVFVLYFIVVEEPTVVVIISPG